MLTKIKEISESDDVSIIALVDALLEHATTFRASDIHLDPLERGMRVRLRIDGVLQDLLTIPKNIQSEIVSRIKVLSGLRTDEHQSAQDGRLRYLPEGAGAVDVRVSITPTYFGENAVLRLLTDKAEEFSLQNLGFTPAAAAKLARAIGKPYGMILSTGPTGSGKTTTLYTIIKKLNTPEVSIVTIEDPIEYAIAGIKQIQVNVGSGLTFSSGLRSILRQDPNVIMVGEIRDAETASIAVNTALTGHLLLSTLHTTDAATTLPRLLDMGVEAFLVASTVNMVIGQRLVRRICETCKKERAIHDDEAVLLSQVMPKEKILTKVFAGTGCEACSGSGYRGRLSVSEMLEVDTAVREAILKRSSARELRRVAIEAGMTPMFEDGLAKMVAGQTTISELFRVMYE